MRFQTKSYSCGSAAIVNALRCFGRRIAERHVWPLADTTDDGTDEEGIVNALASLGYSTSLIQTSTKKEAVWELNQATSLFPVIISAERERHWVTIIGKVCDRYIVVDPARTLRSKRENGVFMMNKRELLKYWLNPNGNDKYYGVIVRGHTK